MQRWRAGSGKGGGRCETSLPLVSALAHLFAAVFLAVLLVACGCVFFSSGVSLLAVAGAVLLLRLVRLAVGPRPQRCQIRVVVVAVWAAYGAVGR